MLVVGDSRQFVGQYVWHWEIPRFELRGQPRLWGLIKPVESCELETAGSISLTDMLFGKRGVPDDIRAPGQRFAITFDGTVLEHGWFGHKGWCRWRIQVDRWIEVSRMGVLPRAIVHRST